MKSKALLLSILMVILLLVGCGPTGSTNSANPEATTSATVKK